MAITASDISLLVARFADDRITKQANSAAPSLNVFKKHNEAGKVGYVRIMLQSNPSTGWLADGGSLPSGTSIDPAQGTYLPKFIFSRLSIPRGAAHLATGKADGINLVLEEMDATGKDLGRKLAKGIFGAQVQTLTAAQATELGAAGTTLTVSDPSNFRPGEVLERRTGAGTLTEYLKVVRVQHDVDTQTGTITFTRDNGDVYADPAGANPATDDELWHVGAYANAMSSLNDVCAATNLYSLTYTSNDWEGNLHDYGSSGGPFDVEIARQMSTQIKVRSGEPWDCMLMNSLNLQRYEDQMLNQRRFVGGKMDAVGGMKPEFEGKPIEVDENIGDKDVYFLNKDAYKLHVFKDFGDDQDGGPVSPQKGGGLTNVLVSDSQFIYDVQRWGAFNGRCNKRSAIGRITNINS